MPKTGSALSLLLDHYRNTSQTEREKGTYFEELIRTYLRYEASYADLFSDVWLYADWAKEQGLDARDTGIDLVAKTEGTDEFYAIQCKCYAEDYRIQKSDIDSFFTASGQKPFTHRIIVTTSNNWSDNAEKSLHGQQIPISKIDLIDLENSQIDWAKYQPSQKPSLKPKFDPRPHQASAITNVLIGLKDDDRGKLIMACGTGKTFTSLKIAEELAGKNKRVLFLVPSLSLLSQSLTEWTQQSKTPLHSFAVCSDSEVGKKRKRDEDIVETFAHELRYPATTDPRSLAAAIDTRHDAQHMSVVFSTYHSIDVISKAQHLHGLGDFDLIICDEAHRTTGATFDDESESNFVKVHDPEFIRSAKRLYMTATPRIYADSAKATAIKDSATLCSMDDEALYGKRLHVINFSEAVQLRLLCDYKVIVLQIDADHVSERLQSLLADENNQLKVDDAARIIGCWKALGKQGVAEDLGDDTDPMKRALAFCQVIEPHTATSNKRGTHKVSSKQISSMFQTVVDAYQEQAEDEDEIVNTLLCEAAHVDGSMNASKKEGKLQWLKDETPEDTCRILSNVRCLSEGVDVPALDAVLFLTPRSSQVDVVQSVGRVMRKDPAGKKKRGYVILPVVIPAGMKPHEALNDNKVYKVVWEVLQALRSHDDRFDAMINKLDLIGKDNKKMEVICITDNIQKKSAKPAKKGKSNKTAGKGSHSIGEATTRGGLTQSDFQFNVGELERALYAKVVKKCGNRNYWDEWAKDIAKIAQTHISRITQIVSNPDNKKEVKAFTSFADELRDDLNDSITNDEVIEMLAQHLITKPVFDALFEDYSFASNNPVSKAMQEVLDILHEHRLEKEADTLEKFYASVKMRAAGIDNAEGKQKIVVELYDKFFRNAFPKMTERLGIVYTPVEVVDFIIHSINDLLKSEFNQTLGCKGVHIIDPFTGTGTFITRLLQSGLISKEQLPHKYKHEIHANEIVLLAYYIAAINIEAVYHSLMSPSPKKAKPNSIPNSYTPFRGICLTDTFQLYEHEDLISDRLKDNSDRRVRQKNLDIRVIMGNPPYSVGQSSANDDNENIRYEELDKEIKKSYVGLSSVPMGKSNAYNSYLRAFRWATDRVGDAGVVGFITGSGIVDKASMDGFRRSVFKDYSRIYILNLRGDVRKNMLSKGVAKEGGNIFDSGSMSGITITFLVKSSMESCELYYHDIGNDLSSDSKLKLLNQMSSLSKMEDLNFWKKIEPDEYGDWINQRDQSLNKSPLIGNKKDKESLRIFNLYSSGVKTNRDAWCYNFSNLSLIQNIKKTITFYTRELNRFEDAGGQVAIKRFEQISKFLIKDAKSISWSLALKKGLYAQKPREYSTSSLTRCFYRPFTKTWMYCSKELNENMARMLDLFPHENANNKAIVLNGVGARSGFSILMTDSISDLEIHDKSQCFPLYLYEKTSDSDDELFTSESENGYTRRDAISDAGLAHFQTSYPAKGEGSTISKEDLFYYIYGLLHSPEYRARYKDNLSKELPRIPAVKKFTDFIAYSKAGHDLAHWHLNYETVETCKTVTLDYGKNDLKAMTDADYYVTKMKFAKMKDPETGKSVNDKSTIIYNPHITLNNIPLDAYDYVVNGKPAIEWVMDRQRVSTDKKSNITNDANLYATETMDNPKYPLELLQRVITVSQQTNQIVKSLPKLEID